MITQDLVPVLETERLLLRGHQIDDFTDSASMWADPLVAAQISGTPSSREQSWSRLLRYTGHWHHLGFGYWAVTSKKDGSFLGEVGFANFCRDTEPSFGTRPEAGWALNTASHGQGFATEAVRAALAWADKYLHHSHTVAMFSPNNAASINVAKKVGYSNMIMGKYANQNVIFMERERRVSATGS